MQIFKLQDHFEGGLTIDGLDLFVSKDAFEEIAVRSSIHRDLPTISIKFDDKGTEAIGYLGTADGKLAQVYMNDGHNGKAYTGSFRLIGGNQAWLSPHGMNAHYSGVLDNPSWMRQVTDRHIQGTSADAISQLAGLAGLQPRVDATADRMTWLPNRRPLAQYARFVAERGWAGATSCMLLAVTEHGQVLYRNLETIMSGQGRLFDHKGKGVMVHQLEVASKAGVYNSSAAYGSTSISQQLSGQLQELNRVSVGQFAPIMSFSSLLAQAVGRYGGRVAHYPIDAGNVHQNYAQARHQNRRIKSTFSNDVHVLTDTASGVNLLDKVRYEAVDPMTMRDLPVFTGEYIVTSIVRMIRYGRYWEKLTFTNQGTGA